MGRWPAFLGSVADLFNLEVDLLLYETTRSYFEMDFDDEERAEREQRWDAYDEGKGPEPTRPRPQVVNDPPLRLRGHSKDHRPDLAQAVIGLAVTREGIPVRRWVFPGNMNDAATIAEVKTSLAGWKLNRVLWAVDRGMVSEKNLLARAPTGSALPHTVWPDLAADRYTLALKVVFPLAK